MKGFRVCVFVVPLSPQPARAARARLLHVCWGLVDVLVWLGQVQESLQDEHWRCPLDH